LIKEANERMRRDLEEERREREENYETLLSLLED
jgi:hypothetical protein